MNRILREILYLSFCIVLAGSTFAQTIQVVDEKTREGIDNVIIYNLTFTKSVPTNKEGIADLSMFQENDILSLQHPAYHEVSFPLKSLNQNMEVISLKEKIISINEVIISASKWEQDQDIIPNTITTVKSKEIEFKNPPTSADLLQESGQVFVQKSQLGGGSPMIRGFSANSVLLVIDGVRMNNAIYRSGNLQNVINVDVNSIKEAEVLFGPGSVMYGSDALGGVMDFHIQNPILTKEGKTSISGNSFLRYSTSANEKTGHFNINIGGIKVGSFTSFSYTDFDDLITGDKRTEKFPHYGKRTEFVIRSSGKDTIISNPNVNKQKLSGYSQYSLIQKLTYRPNDFLDIHYGFYFSNTSNIPRYDRLILYDNDSLPENAEWYYGPQKWIMNRLQTKIYKSNPAFSEARIILSHQWIEESRNNRRYKSDLLQSRIEKVNVFNINADFDKTFDDNHQLFYGLDASFNHVNSNAQRKNIETGESTSISTRYPDGGSEYFYIAFYGNYQWKVNAKTNLNSGLRYTLTRLKAHIEDKGDLGFPYNEFSNINGALNGSLGLAYFVLPKTKLDVVFSSGFRTPNIDDIGKVFDSEPGFVIVPNRDLSPEYSYNAEIGITQNIGKNIKLHTVGFYTWLNNAMVRRDFTFNGLDSLYYDGELRRIQALVNTGKANIYGFSIVLKGDITPHWGIFSSINFTDGKDRIEQVPLRHTPPLFGRTALYYKYKGLLTEFYTQYSGKKAFEDLAPSEQNKPHLYSPDGSLAWYTLNVRFQYQFSQQFTANFGVENILDFHYRTYSSGISAPGRNFIFALRIKM